MSAPLELAVESSAPAPAESGRPPVLLRLAGVTKVYRTGATEVRALDGVDLTIRAGEFVAIMGQSGSGKSTLMHILGCLDRPSGGAYAVAGRAVAGLSPDELATLRRDTFGFVFQRYNLMSTATAAENVEIPAIYAGAGKADRAERALRLLDRLGLGDRARHRPSELSGGQQQRVSIARALMNDPPVILADEPTGALDSRSGEEVMALLRTLHAEGRTILLITHDAEVAAHAERIVQIRDGQIVDDRLVEGRTGASATRPADRPAAHPERRPVGLVAGFGEAVKMAVRSLRVNIFRTALTLLGVVIGVGAVVTMLAVGEGSQRDVMERIQSMGTNLLVVRPGGPGIRSTGDRATLVEADAEALRGLAGIEAVSPERRGAATLRHGNVDYRTTIQGVWPDYLLAREWALAAGAFIVRDDLRSYAPVIVLGDTVARNLFPDGSDPVGRYVLVGNVPFEVVGVFAPKGASAFGSDQDDVAAVPLTTGAMRVFGRSHLSMITVKVAEADAIPAVEAAIRETLIARHRIEDFQVRNTASLLEAAEETQGTLTMLLGSVAAISLLVGGIGVMNIMLVSVTERTREIGVRMATGARMRDILLQFNTEALVVCGIGGLIGVAAGVGVGYALRAFGVSVEFTSTPALLAFACAFLTGVLFGYLPARKAASLDPVVALSAE